MIKEIFFRGPVIFMVLCQLALIIAMCMTGDKNRRSRLCFRIVLAAVLIAAVNLLDYCLVDFDTASTSLEAPLCFIAAWIYAAAAFRTPKRAAAYCTVWVYIITELATQIGMTISDMVSSGQEGFLYVAATVFVYAVFIGAAALLVRFFLVPELQTDGHYHVGRQKLLLTVLIAIVYFILSNFQFIFWLLGEEPEGQSNMITLFRFIVGMACLFFLYLQSSIEKRQNMEKELEMIHQLWYRQQQQYQMSQENIDLINRKCHDLKYQIEALRNLKDGREFDAQLKEMENSIMIYDAVIKTGNPVLDTVLSEKSLFCEKHQINMTCMADGESLNFVGNVDLYTMFGNALDNAVECVMKLKDIQKRIIQVSVYQEKNLLMIRVRNYCAEKPVFLDGIPVSSKKDKGYHGFGLKSIRYTAEKYGGNISCQAADNYFVLQILLPMPR